MKVKKLFAMLDTLQDLNKHLKREKDEDGMLLLKRAMKQFELALIDLKEEKGDAA